MQTEEDALVCSLKRMCCLEIRDLDCFTETNEVKEASKLECSDITNDGIGVTSANFRGRYCFDCKV